jgi:hypothetical protein
MSLKRAGQAHLADIALCSVEQLHSALSIIRVYYCVTTTGFSLTVSCDGLPVLVVY